MNITDKNIKHKEICEQLNKTHYQKSCDYGDSFGETFDKLGVISAVTRISDKYNRLVSLCTKPEEERKVKDESIEDTLLDLANYAIMTVIELHKNTQKICKKDENVCIHNWIRRDYFDEIKQDFVQRFECINCGKVKEG